MSSFAVFYLIGGVIVSEPIYFTVYLHPVDVDIFTDGVHWSNIRVYNQGLTLSDAQHYCRTNNPNAPSGWCFSYCADDTVNDFFCASALIL